MPASWLTIKIKLTDRDATYVQRKLRTETASTVGSNEKRRVVQGLIQILNGIQGGVHGANLWVGVAADNASKPAGSIACTQANAATDTVTFTFGGTTVVFTEGASTSLGFARGASNTTCGAALATAINAHPLLSKLLTAVAVTGTVTLTSKFAAQEQPPITMSTNDGTAFALTQFTGGTAGTATVPLQNIRMGRTP